MSDSQTPPVPGLVAGKYEVIRRIGRGGMGSVWEGRHASLGNRVAIKFIEKEYAESPEARSRFVTEARAAATIQSKHAIQIYDHGVTEDGRPYMVMELLTGASLDRRLEEVGRISLAETARILGQVSRALQRAHDAGIIHRDLKPENIFLVRSPDDDEESAKVLDFGIAKIKGPPGEELTSSTKTGTVLGTPYFMSPEQARGLRNLDYRSDLWSLGVIAYKCVVGVLPFEGESVGDLLVKICTAPVPVPSAAQPGLPATFDAWFARALEREPDKRFSTATELADALAMAAGVSVRRGPMSGRSRLDGVPAGTGPLGDVATAASTPPPTGGLTASGLEAAAVPARPARGLLVAFVAAGVLGVVGAVAARRVGSAPAQGAARAAEGEAAAAAATAAQAEAGIGAGAASGAGTGTAAATAAPVERAQTPAPSASHAVRTTAGPTKPVTPSTASPRPARPKAAAAAADPGY
jgi:eukaryotic-like serine/threonine-protein kinase